MALCKQESIFVPFPEKTQPVLDLWADFYDIWYEDWVVGETIHFKAYVSNDGNVPLTNITVAIDGNTYTIAKLEPDEFNISNSTYTLTQQDYDNGYVLLTITATGYYNGQSVSATKTITVESER